MERPHYHGNTNHGRTHKPERECRDEGQAQKGGLCPVPEQEQAHCHC